MLGVASATVEKIISAALDKSLAEAAVLMNRASVSESLEKLAHIKLELQKIIPGKDLDLVSHPVAEKREALAGILQTSQDFLEAPITVATIKRQMGLFMTPLLIQQWQAELMHVSVNNPGKKVGAEAAALFVALENSESVERLKEAVYSLKGLEERAQLAIEMLRVYPVGSAEFDGIIGSLAAWMALLQYCGTDITMFGMSLSSMQWTKLTIFHSLQAATLKQRAHMGFAGYEKAPGRSQGLIKSAPTEFAKLDAIYGDVSISSLVSSASVRAWCSQFLRSEDAELVAAMKEGLQTLANSEATHVDALKNAAHLEEEVASIMRKMEGVVPLLTLNEKSRRKYVGRLQKISNHPKASPDVVVRSAALLNILSNEKVISVLKRGLLSLKDIEEKVDAVARIVSSADDVYTTDAESAYLAVLVWLSHIYRIFEDDRSSLALQERAARVKAKLDPLRAKYMDSFISAQKDAYGITSSSTSADIQHLLLESIGRHPETNLFLYWLSAPVQPDGALSPMAFADFADFSIPTSTSLFTTIDSLFEISIPFAKVLERQLKSTQVSVHQVRQQWIDGAWLYLQPHMVDSFKDVLEALVADPLALPNQLDRAKAILSLINDPVLLKLERFRKYSIDCLSTHLDAIAKILDVQQRSSPVILAAYSLLLVWLERGRSVLARDSAILARAEALADEHEWVLLDYRKSRGGFDPRDVKNVEDTDSLIEMLEAPIEVSDQLFALIELRSRFVAATGLVLIPEHLVDTVQEKIDDIVGLTLEVTQSIIDEELELQLSLLEKIQLNIKSFFNEAMRVRALLYLRFLVESDNIKVSRNAVLVQKLLLDNTYITKRDTEWKSVQGIKAKLEEAQRFVDAGDISDKDRVEEVISCLRTWRSQLSGTKSSVGNRANIGLIDTLLSHPTLSGSS